MLKTIIKASAFTAILLMQLCLGDTLKAAPGQNVGGKMNLGGVVEADLFIDAPPEISGWMLNPSIPESRKEIALAVSAKTGWQLSVSSNRKNGRMAEYDPLTSSYIQDGKQLESPLKVFAVGNDDHPEPWDVDLAAGGIIQEGEETAGESQKLVVDIEQATSWTDEPLSDGHCYHAVMEFKLSAT
ncbi:MAG: hypothetical protein ACE14P_02830 [Methanotrichaceae archaeon]